MAIYSLPGSGIEIEITDDFDKEALAHLIKDSLENPAAIQEFKKDAIGNLGRMGVKVTGGTPEDIQDDDILAAMGHRPMRARQDQMGIASVPDQQVAIVPAILVVIGVLNAPTPVY